MRSSVRCDICRDEAAAHIRWPVGLDHGATFLHGWVERCDECDVFASDDEAAAALAAALVRAGVAFSFGEAQPELLDRKAPFVDVIDYNAAEARLTSLMPESSTGDSWPSPVHYIFASTNS